MISAKHAKRIRAEMEQHASTLTDEVALEVPEMFPLWTPKAYTMGDRVRYQGVLYKCVQAHPQNETYTPDVAVSLWAQVLNDEIREWVQPDSTNPYMKGDRVRYHGQVWESTIDYNVYAPDVYGWEVVA